MPTQSRQKFRAIAGIAAYTASLTAAVWFLLYQFHQPSTVEAVNPIIGDAHADRASEVTLVRKVEGGCRQVMFDSTGEIQKGAIVPCAVSAGANSTEGRMNAIRDAFSKKN